MLAARPQAVPMGDKLTTHRPERTYSTYSMEDAATGSGSTLASGSGHSGLGLKRCDCLLGQAWGLGGGKEALHCFACRLCLYEPGLADLDDLAECP